MFELHLPYNGFNRTLGTVMVSFYIPDVSFVTSSLSVEFSRQAESFLAEFSIFLSVNFQQVMDHRYAALREESKI